MSYPENDTEFQENTINKVERDGDSFTITSDGWSLWCGENCPIEPQVGQTARQYGRGIGSPVRGLFIDGHKFWYRTPEQDDEHREVQSYGADAAEWLARWDAGRNVWSIEMGGLGPGYEQCIQIVAAEVLRWLLENKPVAKNWSDQAVWNADRERISKYSFEQPTIKALGLSGAQWGAGMSLATRLYMDGPRKVMTTPEIQDRKIQVSKNFPSYVAA